MLQHLVLVFHRNVLNLCTNISLYDSLNQLVFIRANPTLLETLEVKVKLVKS